MAVASTRAPRGVFQNNDIACKEGAMRATEVEQHAQEARAFNRKRQSGFDQYDLNIHDIRASGAGLYEAPCFLEETV